MTLEQLEQQKQWERGQDEEEAFIHIVTHITNSESFGAAMK
jgi:hypothetical protein